MQGDRASKNRCSVVTGAFGFSGQEIASLLLSNGERVRTLTNHQGSESPLRGQVEVHPLHFHKVDQLIDSLRGAEVVYNTYWVRFPYGGLTHAKAVANTKNLIKAAEAAGVRRLVHVSITKPALGSPLTYFRGKAELEEAIRGSALTYAILRPAVLFGVGDILINNIAYMLRRFPAFMVPGDGNYRVQPIHVKDLAKLAVDAGHRSDSYVMDAVGPETYTYLELVKMIRSAIGSKSVLVSTPARIVRFASSLLGYFFKDVILTDQEIQGLMADLLVSDSKPTGRTSLREWIEQHSSEVGRTYASELERHYVREQ